MQIKVGYNEKTDVVVFDYSGICVFVMPYETFKESYYSAKKQREKSKIILPEKKIEVVKN